MIDEHLRIEFRGRDTYLVTECPECGAKAEASLPNGAYARLDPLTLDCYECDEWGEPVAKVRFVHGLL